MKLFKRLVLVLVILVVVAVVVGYLKINSIVKTVVESQGSSQLQVPTTLGSANINLMSGNVGLTDLKIGSPKGFLAPTMFELGGVQVNASLGELSKSPITVASIVIDKPKLVIEQKDGKFNFKELMDQLPKSDTPAQPQDTSAGGKSVKLIVHQLQVNNAEVSIRLGVPIPGIDKTEFTIPVPSMTLKEIGNDDNAQNGAAIKDVVTKTLNGLVGAAADSDKLPEPVRMLLKGDLGKITDQMKNQATQELKKVIPGDLGKLLGGGDGKKK